jgi:hypothetical protein
MKKGLFWAFFLLFCCRNAQSQDLSADAGLFANAKEVFQPLLADPRELQLGLRLVTPVSGTNQGEIQAGEYFGLYRWVLPWEDSYLQWSAGGGVFSRFNMVTEQKDNEVLDYSANMPLDIRVGKWSARVMPYHISSHLGDDYIKRTGILPQKTAYDTLKNLLAYDPWQSLRVYGGFSYIIRNLGFAPGRMAVQGGTEWSSRWWGGGHAQMYWANDVQSWERTAWNPTVNTQLGVRIARRPDDKQKLDLYTEYGAGHMAYGQFYQREESHWDLGIRFEIP